ncbi:MAG: hypothetical protein QXJ02_04350 [Candidatus Bathyarchaeia archaeon]
MIDDKIKKKEDVEELREVLSVVSKEVPALVKGILATVFSEEAGRDMGKAAAAFYKELKNAGMPEETAVKMTEEYMSTFTSLGDLLKGVGRKGGIGSSKDSDELGREISEMIKQKLKEKRSKHHEDDEDEDEDED